MKKILLMCAMLAAAGCQYDVPLAAAPSLPIDHALIGVWESTEENAERMVVLPLSGQEYIVQYPVSEKNGLLFKAFRIQAAGRDLVQVQWLGGVNGSLETNTPAYQVLDYKLDGDTLTLRVLRSSVFTNKFQATEAFAAAVEAARDRADLFEDPGVFRRVLP